MSPLEGTGPFVNQAGEGIPGDAPFPEWGVGRASLSSRSALFRTLGPPLTAPIAGFDLGPLVAGLGWRSGPDQGAGVGCSAFSRDLSVQCPCEWGAPCCARGLSPCSAHRSRGAFEVRHPRGGHRPPVISAGPAAITGLPPLDL